MTLTGSASITVSAGSGPARPEPASAGSVQRVAHCAYRALAVLGLTPVGPMQRCPTLAGRPSRQVVRTAVSAAADAREPVHDVGVSEVAVKVILGPDEATRQAFAWEHEVGWVVHSIADRFVQGGGLPRNPVMRLLHRDPIDVGDACVAISRFVPSTGVALPVMGWARTLGMLHVIGSTEPALALLRRHRATNVLFGLRAEVISDALRRPGHPFRGDAALVLEFASTLRERVAKAMALDPRPLLIHRDFHPLNCINSASGPVAIDWQDAGWGNRSDDFAWLHLAVRRFGRPELLLEHARRAYSCATGGICPTVEQIEASGQVLELLCLGFSIMNADRGPAYLQECLTELPVLADPRARMRRWQMLNNPAIFNPGLVL